MADDDGVTSKGTLERRKLELEIGELARRWWTRPAYVAALTPMFVGLLTLVVAFSTGYLSGVSERLAAQKERLEIDTKNLESRRDKLSQDNVRLAESNQALSSELKAQEDRTVELDEQAKKARAEASRAAQQAASAQHQVRVAELRGLEAQSRELAATAASVMRADPELAVLLSLEALRIATTPLAEAVCRQALVQTVSSVEYAAKRGQAAVATFRRNGMQVIAGGSDGVVRIWSVPSGKLEGEIRVGRDSIHALTISRDERQALLGGFNGLAVLLDLDSKAVVTRFVGHRDVVRAVEFSKDGKVVMTAAGDRTIRTWDADTGKEVSRSDVKDYFSKAAFSVREGVVLLAGHDRVPRAVRIDTGAEVARFEAHAALLTTIAVSPDGVFGAIGSADGVVRVWPATGINRVAELRGDLSGVAGVSLNAARDVVVTGSWDGSVRVWNPAGGRLLGEIRWAGHRVESVALSADGNRVFAASDQGTWRVWDISAMRPLWKATTSSAGFEAIALSPDGRLLASARTEVSSSVQYLEIWDASQGNRLARAKLGWAASSLAFDPTGRVLAVAGAADGTVQMFDVGAATSSKGAVAHPARVRAVTFTRDGNGLITGGEDGLARLWDLRRGIVTTTFSGHVGPVTSVAVSADGKWVATGSSDQAVRVFETAAGRLLRSLTPLPDNVSSVALSTTRKLAAVGADGTLRLTDLSTWSDELTIKEPKALGHSVTFSEDGSLLLVGGVTATVYHGATGRLVKQWRDFGPVSDAVLSSDGRRIGLASTDGSLAVMRCEECVSISDLVRLAEARVPRPLSDSERLQYVGARESASQALERNRPPAP